MIKKLFFESAILFLFSVTICRGQRRNLELNDIRLAVQKINNNKALKSVELNNIDLLGSADAGNYLKGFYSGTTICKLHVWIGLSHCILQYDYYLKNGKQIFICETEDDFAVNTKGDSVDYKKVSRTFEAEYYFKNEQIIDIKTSGKKQLEEYPSAVFIKGLLSDGKAYTKLVEAKIKNGD